MANGYVNAFLKLEGFDGGSKAASHNGEIELVFFELASWQEQPPGPQVDFTYRTGLSALDQVQKLMTVIGRHFPHATLSSANEVVTLNDAVIVRVTTQASWPSAATLEIKGHTQTTKRLRDPGGGHGWRGPLENLKMSSGI
jgi:hypothetical protein